VEKKAGCLLNTKPSQNGCMTSCVSWSLDSCCITFQKLTRSELISGLWEIVPFDRQYISSCY